MEKRDIEPPAHAADSLVQACGEIAATRLTETLNLMLDMADDALFDLADKAESNTAQNRYFDAMREVRVKRSEIQGAFKQNFLASVQGRAVSQENLDLDTLNVPAELTLIANDDVEETLAVNNMVEKIKANCREQLFALDKRMGVLLEDPDLESNANPLRPEAICQAFKAAVHIDSDMEVKLILAKLFDKYVRAEIPDIYDAVNQQLKKHNILPTVRSSVRTHPARAASRASEGRRGCSTINHAGSH